MVIAPIIVASSRMAAISTVKIWPSSLKSLPAKAAVVASAGGRLTRGHDVSSIAKVTIPKNNIALIRTGATSLLERLPCWTSLVSMIDRIINIEMAPI